MTSTNIKNANADVLNVNLKIDIVLIDNFDSFTYNLVNQLTPLVNSITVFRNNVPLSIISKTISDNINPSVIVLSPGPGNPDEAGITLELIKSLQGKHPILGICLGHQSIIQSFGGTIGLAKSVMHGKTSNIVFEKDQIGVFHNLSSPYRVARYHSLAATSMPAELITIAEIDGEIMATKHVSKKILGFQFHPESILTTQGDQLMKNSLTWLTGKTKSGGVLL